MTSGQSVDQSYRYDAVCDIANVTTTDGDPTHYLEDPELFADNLPQPFRRINRILSSVIDNVLDIGEAHESKLIHDDSRRQAPKYDSANILEVLHLIYCCFPTKYVFTTLPCEFFIVIVIITGMPQAGA